MSVEPEWVVAQREESRQFGNIWKGMFLGNVLSALVFALVSSVERDVYAPFGGYVFALICIASLYIAKRSKSGSLIRPATATVGLLFGFAAVFFLFGSGGA